MKNLLFCLLSFVFLFSVLPSAHAGFVVKKNAVAAITTNTGNSRVTVGTEIAQKASHPIYQRVAYRGWQGIFALACGVAGFFWGGFALLAVLFGLMGMGRRHRNSSLAIAGFVLGLAAILLAIFTGFWGFALY